MSTRAPGEPATDDSFSDDFHWDDEVSQCSDSKPVDTIVMHDDTVDQYGEDVLNESNGSIYSLSQSLVAVEHQTDSSIGLSAKLEQVTARQNNLIQLVRRRREEQLARSQRHRDERARLNAQQHIAEQSKRELEIRVEDILKKVDQRAEISCNNNNNDISLNTSDMLRLPQSPIKQKNNSNHYKMLTKLQSQLRQLMLPGYIPNLLLQHALQQRRVQVASQHQRLDALEKANETSRLQLENGLRTTQRLKEELVTKIRQVDHKLRDEKYQAAISNGSEEDDYFDMDILPSTTNDSNQTILVQVSDRVNIIELKKSREEIIKLGKIITKLEQSNAQLQIEQMDNIALQSQVRALESTCVNLQKKLLNAKNHTSIKNNTLQDLYHAQSAMTIEQFEHREHELMQEKQGLVKEVERWKNACYEAVQQCKNISSNTSSTADNTIVSTDTTSNDANLINISEYYEQTLLKLRHSHEQDLKQMELVLMNERSEFEKITQQYTAQQSEWKESQVQYAQQEQESLVAAVELRVASIYGAQLEQKSKEIDLLQKEVHLLKSTQQTRPDEFENEELNDSKDQDDSVVFQDFVCDYDSDDDKYNNVEDYRDDIKYDNNNDRISHATVNTYTNTSTSLEQALKYTQQLHQYNTQSLSVVQLQTSNTLKDTQFSQKCSEYRQQHEKYMLLLDNYERSRYSSCEQCIKLQTIVRQVTQYLSVLVGVEINEEDALILCKARDYNALPTRTRKKKHIMQYCDENRQYVQQMLEYIAHLRKNVDYVYSDDSKHCYSTYQNMNINESMESINCNNQNYLDNNICDEYCEGKQEEVNVDTMLITSSSAGIAMEEEEEEDTSLELQLQTEEIVEEAMSEAPEEFVFNEDTSLELQLQTEEILEEAMSEAPEEFVFKEDTCIESTDHEEFIFSEITLHPEAVAGIDACVENELDLSKATCDVEDEEFVFDDDNGDSDVNDKNEHEAVFANDKLVFDDIGVECEAFGGGGDDYIEEFVLDDKHSNDDNKCIEQPTDYETLTNDDEFVFDYDNDMINKHAEHETVVNDNNDEFVFDDYKHTDVNDNVDKFVFDNDDDMINQHPEHDDIVNGYIDEYVFEGVNEMIKQPSAYVVTNDNEFVFDQLDQPPTNENIEDNVVNDTATQHTESFSIQELQDTECTTVQQSMLEQTDIQVMNEVQQTVKYADTIDSVENVFLSNKYDNNETEQSALEYLSTSEQDFCFDNVTLQGDAIPFTPNSVNNSATSFNITNTTTSNTFMFSSVQSAESSIINEGENVINEESVTNTFLDNDVQKSGFNLSDNYHTELTDGTITTCVIVDNGEEFVFDEPTISHVDNPPVENKDDDDDDDEFVFDSISALQSQSAPETVFTSVVSPIKLPSTSTTPVATALNDEDDPELIEFVFDEDVFDSVDFEVYNDHNDSAPKTPQSASSHTQQLNLNITEVLTYSASPPIYSTVAAKMDVDHMSNSMILSALQLDDDE